MSSFQFPPMKRSGLNRLSSSVEVLGDSQLWRIFTTHISITRSTKASDTIICLSHFSKKKTKNNGKPIVVEKSLSLAE